MPGGYAFDRHIPVPAFDAATTGDAAPVTIPFAQYVVRNVYAYGASANLAATTATLALHTASGGGGTAIVTGQALTALTASLVMLATTVATPATVFTASSLYPRITQGVGPVAGTIKLVIEVVPLP